MKFRSLIWIFFTLAVLGCRHDSDSEQSEQNVSPLLNTIPEQSVVTGKTLTIRLRDDTGAVNVVFTTDGTVGPNKNPYAEQTPATFDAGQGIFAWTPTDAEAGDYSVQFTATDETSSPTSVNQTVSITVYTPAQFGMRLFGERCAACHGEDATGLSAKSILLKSRDDIALALDTVPEMAPLKAALTDEEIDWIGLGLAALRARLAEHAGVDPAATCESCHDGAKASGKNSPHIPTTSDCGLCHLPAAWVPTDFDHSSVSGACIACHWNPFGPSLPSNHIASTSVCGACHGTDAWKPVTAVDHSQVIGTCASCHVGTAATGGRELHTFSDHVCEACHSTTAFVPALRVDHSHVIPNTCSSCHGTPPVA